MLRLKGTIVTADALNGKPAIVDQAATTPLP
jgi:hypothetical protein